MKSIADRLKKYLIRRSQLWGVEFESDLPSEFVITDHAAERLRERFPVSKNKQKQVVIKAFYSEQVPSETFLNRKKYNSPRYKKQRYKIFQGYVFVFAFQSHPKLVVPQKVLITVLKYKK